MWSPSIPNVKANSSTSIRSWLSHRANLEALQLQKEHLGEAMPPLMASQITELEEQLSETSRRISELER